MSVGPDKEQTLFSHLLELRDRLLRAVIMVVVVFIPLAVFSSELFTWLSGPLLAHMPIGSSLIATEVAAPFLAPFKLSILLAVVISLPWILYQIWAFVAPGLYMNERRLVVPLLATSTSLFYLGMAFAYYIVFPVVFGFFVSVAPEGVAVMTDISRYLDFVLGMFMAFGIAFEVPVALFLLVWAGFTTPADLASYRPYVLVGAFAIAMLLTPPDMISQTLLAVPIFILYEAGIWGARLFVPGIREVEAQKAEQKRDE
ncbi:twin-arginine translocase subunit TatC [Salinisphaera sp. P385]|uniref:Sec-independent protein translocase protein TatC n=1 Tax=Spectribacter acetivorans TaxID=3075603 RepID=A0ABU3B9H8_9GAMM|nr:twin-arginine translocase subunit TatC [Salinisphaera sp. P385]MDT0618884.1 twin-arginine translocase subunit TatC [Salinisphaera sp. P385]